MTELIDVSAFVVDPGDEYRLFAFPEDAAAASALLTRTAPPAAGAGRLIAPPVYYRLAEGAADVRAANDFILAAAAAPDVLGALGTVEPRHLEEGHRELERLARLGAVGVAWSPRAQGVMADDRLLVEACRRAHDLGLTPVIRAHPYSANESLERIRRLARACAEGPILVTGALMSWESAQAVLAAPVEANLHFDVADLTEGVPIGRLIDMLGEDRVLYGCGARTTAARCWDEWRERLDEASAPAATREKFLKGNAERLFRLGRRQGR
jgi:predicted TIM-barrel fold metal-dependent hydrolase